MLRRVSNLDSNHEGPSAADLKLVILNPSSWDHVLVCSYTCGHPGSRSLQLQQ
jgi:hypothetical protein